MRQSTSISIDNSVTQISEFYADRLADAGVNIESDGEQIHYNYLDQTLESVERSISTATFIQIALIVAALIILFIIYSKIQKREKQIEVEKLLAEETSRAKTSFLSNMSHEIRTPMSTTSVARRNT